MISFHYTRFPTPSCAVLACRSPATPRLLSRNHLLTLRLKRQVKTNDTKGETRRGPKALQKLNAARGASGEGCEVKHRYRLRRDRGRGPAERGARLPAPGRPSPAAGRGSNAKRRSGAGARGRGASAGAAAGVAPWSPHSSRSGRSTRPPLRKGARKELPITKSDRGRIVHWQVLFQLRGLPYIKESIALKRVQAMESPGTPAAEN